MKHTLKLNEKQLRQIIKETINELDWKTYANAAKKAHAWRSEHPFQYDRNRGLEFDSAAQDAFDKQHGIEYLPDYGGERGNINFTSVHGEPSLSGSRNHDFGDNGGPFDLKHNVYHMGKKYGKDGGYGRARMWDFSHETTPEEFYGSDEMGKKFRDAEQDVENYNNGKYDYTPEKGWHLKESKLNKVVKESIKKVLNETSYDLARAAHKANSEQRLQAAMNHEPEDVQDKLRRRGENLFGHLKDRASQRFNPDMPVVIVDENGVRELVAGKLDKYYKIKGICEPFENPIYNDSPCIGYPKLEGYCGPMWDGDKIRYESWEVYDELSR